MDTGIQPFSFEGHAVEVLVEGEEVLFLASDACERCGIGNVADAMSRLDDDEKTKRNRPTSTPSRMGAPPVPASWYLTEAGLYALANGSRTPESKRFRRWVNHEVLPAIRRTGAYVAPGAQPAALDLRDPAALRGLLAQLAEVNLEQAKELEVARPKAVFVDRYVGAARGLVGLQQLAKQLHQPERKFVEWLRSAGYLYRDGEGVLVPKAEYGPTGSRLFEVRTWTVNDVVRRQTMATPKAGPYFTARLPQTYAPVRRLPAAHRSIQHQLPGAQP